MQLHPLISKFVLLAMLFTVFSTSVNAGLLDQMPMPGNSECHSASQSTCCSEPDSTSRQLSPHCNPSAMDAHSPNSSCCVDNDCHANGMQVAILSEFNTISVPSASQEFSEPEGDRMFFYEVHLRPPVSV